MIFYITLILMAMLIIILGILTIKALTQMYEQFYWYKPSFKEEAKKRYERKINKTNATKRIQKTTKNL